MNLTHFNFIFVLLASLLLDLASFVNAGGFKSTCKDIRVTYYTAVLSAQCRARDGSYRQSTLDLNKCLTSKNGVLHWERDGYVQFRCTNFWTWAGGRDLHADCVDDNDFWVTDVTINLNNGINNYDGNLACL